MIRRISAAVFAISLLGAAPGPSASSAPAPLMTPMPAPTAPVTDVFFGQQVTDRYRYLETAQDPRTKAFFADQAAVAHAYLASLGPARTALGKRIYELDRSSVSVGSVIRLPGVYMYERQDPNAESESLYVRGVDGGAPQVLVDPTVENDAHTHHTIDWVVPSYTGRYVAFGLSAGGSEESLLHILDRQTGRRLPETIDRTRYGATGWLPDGKSLIYIRLPRTTAATPVVDRDRFFRAYIHRVGDPVSADRPVFGWKVDPAIRFSPDDVPAVGWTPGSKYAIGTINHGVQNEVTLYSAPVKELETGGPVHWRKVIDVPQAVTGYDVHGSTLYVLSHRDASTYRVQRIDLDGPPVLHEVVRPGRAVIQQIGVAHDGLYLRTLDAGIGRIERVAFDTTPQSNTRAAQLALPYDGTVEGIVTDPRFDGVTFGLTGWTHSLLWYAADAAGKLHDTKLKPLSPVDASPYTSEEVEAISADGTHVPLSLIMKKGTVLDGSHPTYLEGYGAYGVVLSPYFSATRIAWLERGGIYAVAHVRGGGEFGENWHRAAMRATKERSIDDYIACARYLIERGYTAPKFLAGEGTSAGGIVIGGAITRAPQLFAAALDVVGVSDALRSEFSSNGPGNIPEFGTVTNPDEFKSLLATDAYQQVRDGTPYPAVMLVTGLNDPRVPSWELGKFAARLQAATSSGKPVILRIDGDAGHGFLAASRTQAEALLTDEYSFLLAQMGKL